MDIVFNEKRDKVASFSCRRFPVESISAGKEFFTKKDFKVLIEQVSIKFIIYILFACFIVRMEKMLMLAVSMIFRV